MKNRKTKYLILVLSIFGLLNCYCQNSFKKVSFEILYEENDPLPGTNIMVKNSIPIIETQSDFNGKAELNLNDLNVYVELSYGPRFKFKLLENVDFIKVYLKKKKVTYYSKNKILKKGKLKGY